AAFDRNPFVTGRTDREHLRDMAWHAEIMAARQADLTHSLGMRLQKRLGAMSAFDAFNAVQNHAIALAGAYAERLVLDAFHTALKGFEGPVEHRAILDDLARLHGLYAIERERAWFLENGYIDGDKARAIRDEVDALCAALRPHALALVEGGRCLARLALREITVPGVYRRWALLGEPVPTTAPVDHAVALAALARLARAQRVDVLDCKFNMARWATAAVEAVVPASAHELFGTYLVELGDGLDGVLKGMRTNHRRLWRKIEQLGPEVRHRLDFEPFLALLDETYQLTGKKMPHGAAYLRTLLTTPAVPVVAVGVHHEGALQAGVLVAHDRHRGYYLHGAARRDGLPGAAVMAHVEAMRLLIERGVPIYDLGGARPEHSDARLAGIADFKRRFGGPFEAVSRFEWPLTRRGAWLHGPGRARLEQLRARIRRQS
ncbi:MAG: GNAT family N-acetyltransferase, partial [Myxococcales bacterium]|nr:GNAT family N-acetyltransferase [Myxococcales bacterium]